MENITIDEILKLHAVNNMVAIINDGQLVRLTHES